MSELRDEELLSAEDFSIWANLPENENRVWELERGKPVELAIPGAKHGVTCGLLCYVLGRYCIKRGRGYALANNCGIIVESNPDTVRGPDLIYIDEQPRIEEMGDTWIKSAPCLVVEVLSFDETPEQMINRVGEYLRHGIAVVWVVDPELRSVSVHRSGQQLQVLDNSDELLDEDVLPGFRCRVSDLFRMPGEVESAQ